MSVEGLTYRKRHALRLAVFPPDVIHVHWFERAFWAPNQRTVFKHALHVAILIMVLKVRGSRLVWTAHDPNPHQSPLNRWLFDGKTAALWKRYERRLLSRIDGVLLMSDSHRPLVIAREGHLKSVSMEVVRHPHYRGQYPDPVDRAAAREILRVAQDAFVIVFVGSLRVYKNPDGLIEAFRGVEGSLRLLVAGEAETPERAEFLRSLAAQDSRVLLHIGFVPDDELSTWLRAADISVLPYHQVTNSGSALLALSFDVPILVPDEAVFRELEDLVGPQWVKRYSGDISSDAITAAVEWAKARKSAEPDLSALGWASIAAHTLDFFRKVTRSKPDGL